MPPATSVDVEVAWPLGSVGEFARELKKPAEILLEQLRAAGVEKPSAYAQLTTRDVNGLLKYLQ